MGIFPDRLMRAHPAGIQPPAEWAYTAHSAWAIFIGQAGILLQLTDTMEFCILFQLKSSCLQVHKMPASLEAPAGAHDDNSTLADFIEDETDVNPDDAALQKLLTQDMNNLLYTLSERESEVLRLRYGLEDGTERTLEEVGRVMMVSVTVGSMFIEHILLQCRQTYGLS